MDTSNDGTTTSATDIVTHQMSLLRGGRGPSISGRFGVRLLGFMVGLGGGSGDLPCVVLLSSLKGLWSFSVRLVLFSVAYVPGATLCH